LTATTTPTSPNLPRHPKAVERLHQARLLVENELRRVAVGDRLPPVRELRERCGVGLAQLQAVMADMEREGLIDRRPRSGLYKAQSLSASPRITTIDLIACRRVVDIYKEDRQHFAGNLTESLAIEAGRRGLAIRLHQVYATESIARYEAIANDPAVRACILMMPHLSELPAMFERRGVPVISLFPKQPLWSLGHHRIAYMSTVDPHYPDMIPLQRREAYYRLMAHRGLPVESNWVFTLPSEFLFRQLEEYQDGPCHEILDQVFTGPRCPTAAIISDPLGSSLYRFAQKRGLRIGRDLSVIGTDDILSNTMLQPAMTSIRNKHSDTAVMAIESLLDMSEGRSVPTMRQVTPQLIVRASTGPCLSPRLTSR
jgi:DNA-binding LacI/PurR family transcriptional regulator